MHIIFLCIGNSARSQMAEGLGRELLKDIANVSSAGSQPTRINSLAITVMKEIDIDISHHKSKSVDLIDKDKIDLVITLCAEEICPVLPGNVKQLHWPLPDPANLKYNPDEQLKLFRNVRDNLKNKILLLKNEIQTWKK